MARAANPFGDGRASERIVAAQLGEPVEPFGVAELIRFMSPRDLSSSATHAIVPAASCRSGCAFSG